LRFAGFVQSHSCGTATLFGLDHLDGACDYPHDQRRPRDPPCEPQAAVQLIKVDLSVVAKGYRMSKMIGSTVINDKNEKIGTVDDVIADKDKKQLSFAVLQVGGFLGLGGRLVAVPYDSLVIDDAGQKVTLPGASKDELKKLSEFNYPA
jgi:sporulation protein YlmC with PRC-barrel domain